jgi:sugar lactone lactonase YvrE
VQAVRSGEVVDGTVSDENGKYQFVSLDPGEYQVRCYAPYGYVYYGSSEGKDGRKSQEGKTLKVEPDTSHLNIDFRLAPIKRGAWTTFDSLDGLPSDYVNALHIDSDGYLWLGTRSGICRFDGKEFTNYNLKYGLEDFHVEAIYEDSQGNLWFGTGWYFAEGIGIYRFDGNSFARYTTEDGLANDSVRAIQQDRSGRMWFGTRGGLSCFDGEKFVNITKENGLAANIVYGLWSMVSILTRKQIFGPQQ